MNDDWAWVFTVLCIVVVLLSPVACTMHKQHVIGEVLKTRPHTEPVAVRCAFSPDFCLEQDK